MYINRGKHVTYFGYLNFKCPIDLLSYNWFIKYNDNEIIFINLRHNFYNARNKIKETK